MNKIGIVFLALVLCSTSFGNQAFAQTQQDPASQSSPDQTMQTPQVSSTQAPAAQMTEPLDVSQNELRCGLCEAAESHNWKKSVPGKLGRGLVNAGLGWTNLFVQPVRVSSSGGSVWKGMGKGLNDTLLRSVQGVTELIVFWIPPAKTEALTRCTLGDMGATRR